MYVLAASDCAGKKWTFCGPECLIGWLRTGDYSRQVAEALEEGGRREFEAMGAHLVAAGAVSEHDSASIDTLVEELFRESSPRHLTMHHCANCGEPKPMLHSYIVLSPGMNRERGPRFRRVLCSPHCVLASLEGDIQRAARNATQPHERNR